MSAVPMTYSLRALLALNSMTRWSWKKLRTAGRCGWCSQCGVSADPLVTGLCEPAASNTTISTRKLGSPRFSHDTMCENRGVKILRTHIGTSVDILQTLRHRQHWTKRWQGGWLCTSLAPVPKRHWCQTVRGKTSESVHCTILNKLCACQRMRHRPSACPLYRFGRLALSGHFRPVWWYWNVLTPKCPGSKVSWHQNWGDSLNHCRTRIK